MKQRWIIAAVLAAHGIVPLAQTREVSKDSAWPQAAAPTAGSASTPAPYRRFVITRPAEQSTVRTGTGEFGISATVSPPLRSSDRIRVLLDGNLVPSVYRGTNLRISESDWQSAATGTQGEHRIQLAIVDVDGRPWIETAPLSFFVQRVGDAGSATR